MPDTPQRGKKRERTHLSPGSSHRPPAEQPGEGVAYEDQPAQDWGERTETGKTIARGGQTEGKVSGANEKKPS